MKIITIIGALPQVIKASPINKALKNDNIDEIIIQLIYIY